MDESNWAVIQNLHLFPYILDEIVDDLKRFGNAINSEFRLWMIGYSTPKYSSTALQYCYDYKILQFSWFCILIVFVCNFQVLKLSVSLRIVSVTVCLKL